MHFQWHTALCHSPVSSKFDYFPSGLLHLFSAASEFGVIFKLPYSGTDRDCLLFLHQWFWKMALSCWCRKPPFSPSQNSSLWAWCYMEVEQFSMDLQVGHFPTPFYLFSEISCLWLGHSVMAYRVQEHWGWNHKFSNGVYDVCYQAEVSYFMPSVVYVTCSSGLIVKCYHCEVRQHSGLILKNLWMVAGHQTYVLPAVQFICSFTFAVR